MISRSQLETLQTGNSATVKEPSSQQQTQNLPSRLMEV